MEKLNPNQVHFIKLIGRDKQEDGWTPVSDTLYPFLTQTMPSEIAELSGCLGGYRVRLTDEGENILAALEWL